MKKSFLILFFTFLFLGGFYFISFHIPRTAVIERPQNLSVNYSNIISTSSPENYQKKPFFLKMISDIKDDLILENKSFLEINLSAMKIKLYKDGKPT